MFWSTFSAQWYEVTCSDLGLEFVAKSKEVKEFIGEKETTYYLLYRKPLREKNNLLNQLTVPQQTINPNSSMLFSPPSADLMLHDLAM